MKTPALYDQLEKALTKMTEALTFPNDEPHNESTIQRFEYTFELSWKLMNSILHDQGVDTYGVKNVIREAYKLRLIDSVENWLLYANARNQTAHICQQSIANEVTKVARGGFVNDVRTLLKTTSAYQAE